MIALTVEGSDEAVKKPNLYVYNPSPDDCREERAFSPFKAGVSLLAVGLLLASNAAYAQDAAEPESGDEIIVTGIRESLANAQKIKKDSDTVVDAITSEDIGALPDRSVTEALQRVPGVAINRFAGSNDPDHFSVEGSGVVIRGLNFVRSEFNGRDAFVAGVGGQALNFADVPSELLGSVIIAKNSTADMIEGGLAGTVNLNTRKPFDRKGFHFALSAEGNYGDFRKEWTPTFSGLISKTWETDSGTFGLLASASYSRIKSRADGFQITNFQTRDGTYVSAANAGTNVVCRSQLPGSTDAFGFLPGRNCGGAAPAGADGFADLAGVRYAPLGGQFRTQEFDRKRDGFNVSAQWESTDQRTQLTAEFIRSHTTNKWNERTFETGSDLSEYNTFPRGCRQNDNGAFILNGPNGVQAANTGPGPRAECPNGFTNFIYDDTGLFQQGYIVQQGTGWRGNDPLVPVGGLQQTMARRLVDEETTNSDFGLHLKTQLTDRFTINLDAQYAKSRKQNTDLTIHGSTFADQELDLRGDLPVVTPHAPNNLGYAWGGDAGRAIAGLTDAQYFADPRFSFFRSAMDHIEDSSGSQYAFKADMEYEFPEDSFIRRVKAGARYSDRDQTVRYTTYNWGMLSEVWSGPRPLNFADVSADQRTQYAFPDFFRGQVTPPSNAFYANVDGLKSYEDWVAYTTAIKARRAEIGGFSNFVSLANRPGAIAGTPFLRGDIQPIAQQDFSAYGMVAFGTDNSADGIRISGNVGLRYVHTSLKSDGFPAAPSQGGLNISDPYNTRCPVLTNPITGTSSRGGGVCNLSEAEYGALQTFANAAGQFASDRNSYSYLLPSANLKLGITDDVVVRFAASKVLTRPLNDYLRNFFNYQLQGGGNLTAEAGNPTLRPATAWQFDASAEWYFARVGSVSLNLFYKDIKDFFFQSVESRAITNNGVTQNVLVRLPENFGGKGKIKGFELAYQQTYDFLPGFLSGLGVSANYTFIKSKGLPSVFLNAGGTINPSTVTPGNLPLEQLSKHNVNATIFYEKGPISLRAAYNWRSRFLLTAADVIFPYYSIFNEATGQLDASAFFSVTKDIKIGVQGVNLLNEVTKTSQAYTGSADLLAPRSYFMNDRRFSFVVRGNF
jgi:TonB-dependent receptor